MDVEHCVAADLRAGDVIATNDFGGLWQVRSVERVPADGGAVELDLSELRRQAGRHIRLKEADIVRRVDRSAIHDADEFIGMSVSHAAAWAGALGWAFRDRSAPGWYTDDFRWDRINVWADEHGVVVRAELF